MRIDVLFFGHFRDFFSDDALELSLPEGATVRDLASALAAQDTRLGDLTRHCRFAVNEAYAPLETSLQENDTVAVLPPMSGG